MEMARDHTPSSVYPTISYHQVDVGSTAAEQSVDTLGGPFDIAVAQWLYLYAGSKQELHDMIRWTGSVLKPGGLLIAVTPSIRNLDDAHNGTVPGFSVKQIFGAEKKEGLYLEKWRYDGHTIDYYTSLFT